MPTPAYQHGYVQQRTQSVKEGIPTQSDGDESRSVQRAMPVRPNDGGVQRQQVRNPAAQRVVPQQPGHLVAQPANHGVAQTVRQPSLQRAPSPQVRDSVPEQQRVPMQRYADGVQTQAVDNPPLERAVLRQSNVPTNGVSASPQRVQREQHRPKNVSNAKSADMAVFLAESSEGVKSNWDGVTPDRQWQALESMFHFHKARGTGEELQRQAQAKKEAQKQKERPKRVLRRSSLVELTGNGTQFIQQGTTPVARQQATRDAETSTRAVNDRPTTTESSSANGHGAMVQRQSTSANLPSSAGARSQTTTPQTQKPTAGTEPVVGKAPLETVWPVEQIEGDELDANSAPVQRMFTEDKGEARQVESVLRSVSAEKSTDSTVQFVPPSRPRPQPHKTRTPAPVQRKPQQSKVVDSEIGPLPSDLWSLVGADAPSADNSQSVQRHPATDPPDFFETRERESVASRPQLMQQPVENAMSATRLEQMQTTRNESPSQAVMRASVTDASSTDAIRMVSGDRPIPSSPTHSTAISRHQSKNLQAVPTTVSKATPSSSSTPSSAQTMSATAQGIQRSETNPLPSPTDFPAMPGTEVQRSSSSLISPVDTGDAMPTMGVSGVSAESTLHTPSIQPPDAVQRTPAKTEHPATTMVQPSASFVTSHVDRSETVPNTLTNGNSADVERTVSPLAHEQSNSPFNSDIQKYPTVGQTATLPTNTPSTGDLQRNVGLDNQSPLNVPAVKRSPAIVARQVVSRETVVNAPTTTADSRSSLSTPVTSPPSSQSMESSAFTGEPLRQKHTVQRASSDNPSPAPTIDQQQAPSFVERSVTPLPKKRTNSPFNSDSQRRQPAKMQQPQISESGSVVAWRVESVDSKNGLESPFNESTPDVERVFRPARATRETANAESAFNGDLQRQHHTATQHQQINGATTDVERTVTPLPKRSNSPFNRDLQRRHHAMTRHTQISDSAVVRRVESADSKNGLESPFNGNATDVERVFQPARKARETADTDVARTVSPLPKKRTNSPFNSDLQRRQHTEMRHPQISESGSVVTQRVESAPMENGLSSPFNENAVRPITQPIMRQTNGTHPTVTRHTLQRAGMDDADVNDIGVEDDALGDVPSPSMGALSEAEGMTVGTPTTSDGMGKNAADNAKNAANATQAEETDTPTATLHVDDSALADPIPLTVEREQEPEPFQVAVEAKQLDDLPTDQLEPTAEQSTAIYAEMEAAEAAVADPKRVIVQTDAMETYAVYIDEEQLGEIIGSAEIEDEAGTLAFYADEETANDHFPNPVQLIVQQEGIRDRYYIYADADLVDDLLGIAEKLDDEGLLQVFPTETRAGEYTEHVGQLYVREEDDSDVRIGYIDLEEYAEFERSAELHNPTALIDSLSRQVYADIRYRLTLERERLGQGVRR